jgi:pyruvate dehydrogenase E2 component (dihydrolipoamide acetyltransferase)
MAPPAAAADTMTEWPCFEIQPVQAADHAGGPEKSGKSAGTITIRAIAGPPGRRRARSFSVVPDTPVLGDRPARSLGGAADDAAAAGGGGARAAAAAAPAAAPAAAAAPAEDDAPSAEHMAMLDSLRAQWQVPKDAPVWRKLQA